MTQSKFLEEKAKYESFKQQFLSVENELKLVIADLYKEENSTEKNNELLEKKEELSKQYLDLMDEFNDVQANYEAKRHEYFTNPEPDPEKISYPAANPNTLHLE